MLARIAHELYWLGRNLARAEFTARAVEAVFQAELQGTADALPGVRFGSGGLLAMLDSVTEERRADTNRPAGTETLGRLTGDAELPGSMLASVGRAREGARAVRDVISAEMWEAINTTTLALRRDRPAGWGAHAQPYVVSQYVKQRIALVWGIADRSMLRDEAKCFLDAGCLIEVADMVLRMLRVALPGEEAAQGDGSALILLQAVGGYHAYLRAETAPPNAHPVARFLLFERAYPDSVAACVDSLHEVLGAADAGPRNSKPVLRLSRLAADLDFQRRALPQGAELTGICTSTQRELARIDQDLAERYFAGAANAGNAFGNTFGEPFGQPPLARAYARAHTRTRAVAPQNKHRNPSPRAPRSNTGTATPWGPTGAAARRGATDTAARWGPTGTAAPWGPTDTAARRGPTDAAVPWGPTDTPRSRGTRTPPPTEPAAAATGD
jgi:uncharacterized alpha-E superfamily protein